jgi:hypothetical protein
MSEDGTANVPTPQAIDHARVSEVFDSFRSSTRRYMDSATTSFDKATEVNKQASAFHERLLLIDLGTIGLSVTALTSVASKVAMVGFRKYLIIVLVGLAWCLLLLSAFLCRAIMNDYLAANRKLYEDWKVMVLESAGEHISQDIERLSTVISGVIQISAIQKEDAESAATKLRSIHAEARRAHLEKTLQTGGTKESLSTGRASLHAIHYMQWALMLLAVAAMALVIAL